ncbi:MAG: hypothetical protein ACI85F_000191 [Bacteroidia bacterium]|jgi:hypothetical protein
MIPNLPSYINWVFLAVAIYTIVMFYFSNGKNLKATLAIIAWSVLHCSLAYTGFFINTEALPPRFTFVLLPATLAIIYSVLPKQRASIISNRDFRVSTFLHTVRIPVEICLFLLFSHGMVPELMTFEGRNFDILAGITAPVIGFLFLKNWIGTKGMIAWNAVSLGLVLFILVNGVLSTELPFQQFAFDQPNRAMMYVPFVLLPATVVPIVVFTHITDILKLKSIQKDRKQ